MKTRKSANYLRALLSLAVFALICPARPSFAAFGGDDKGTSAAQFLKLGAGARAAAMGEAYSAVCADAGAVYWNPGALSGLHGISGVFTHTELFGALNYEYLGYAQSLKTAGTVGLGIQYLSAGQIPETDTSGFETGADMNPVQLAAALAYSRKIGGFGIGASAKYIRSRLVETASTFAADAGILSPALFNGRLRLASVVQNAGGGLKYDRKSDPLPLNLKAGGAFSFSDKIILALDVNFPRDNGLYAGAGGEYVFNYRAVSVAGRLGYNTRTQGDIDGMAGLSTGLGFIFHNLALDYAFVPFGSLGSAHRISVNFRFGDKTPPR